ncbi:MAG: hypothetical protein ABSB70_16580 [Candidatus Velthaea sp.]
MWTRLRSIVLIALGVAAIGATLIAAPLRPRAAALPPTFESAGDAAAATLKRRFYHAPGRWNMCVPDGCGTAVRDWGADSLAYALYLRWRLAADPDAPAIMNALAQSAPTYDSCRRGACTMWSDVPMWDAIAAARAYEVTGNPSALAKARRAFAVVDRSDAFALGACPGIDYQKPSGGNTALKTLETDSNYIKAALLLHHLTHVPAYLTKAKTKYAAVRRFFLDPGVPLYSVYVFDDGSACRQLPKRFFASVNGNMIWNGLALAAQTGSGAYFRDAIGTARAVARYLSDPSGVYANFQAENDVAEPLIEAMADLATVEHQAFARRWLLTAAAAAKPAASGAYGRFFDGPPPDGPISAWASSGGLALAIVAGALEPGATAPPTQAWAAGHFVRAPIAAASASISFSGRAIALIGAIGDVCCEAGHARVFIDGRETFDRTGIWQNKSSSGQRLPNSVLLSWRWPRSGRHTIAFKPGIANAKEGGSFLHLAGYELVP